MPLLPKRPVRRRRDGRFDINLAPEERRALRSQLEQFRDLLLANGPLLRRLFPTAYPNDEERDREYQQLMRGDLIESHFTAIETMDATLDEEQLDEAQLAQWMHCTNALRLVLGTALDVCEDDTLEDLEEDDPEYELHVLYSALTWLLHFIVEALTAALPPPTADER